MRKVLSYLLTLVNFAGFLLVFVVTRDLYRTLFAVLYGLATSRDMSAFQVSAALRTFDMVGMFVMGLAAIVLIIVIQSVYEGARDGVQLGARFATVSGMQMAWIGATRVLVWLLPVGVHDMGLDGYTLVPLAAGGAAIAVGILLRRRTSASRS
ncbi:MAG: hypothetical protein OXH96_15825 [Spirochaetaceae bacterium]|nr:hypothetical protein [Spirochaetaceae bacterium]